MLASHLLSLPEVDHFARLFGDEPLARGTKFLALCPGKLWARLWRRRGFGSDNEDLGVLPNARCVIWCLLGEQFEATTYSSIVALSATAREL